MLRPGEARFTLTTEAPKSFHKLVYFVKDGSRFITHTTIDSCVQFGRLYGTARVAPPLGGADDTAWGGALAGTGGSFDQECGPAPGPLAALERVLGSVYLPPLLVPPDAAAAGSGAGQDGGRRELLASTHRYLAALTEAVYDATGRTVLYVPLGEGLEGRPPGEAARDRALVQRLEATAIHWTRQVRGVLHKAEQLEGLAASCSGSGGVCGQQHGGVEGGGGPLEEIAFWRRRALDLGGLDAQLRSPDVAAAVAVLSAAGSGYLAEFEAQRGVVAEGAAAARNNERYLAALGPPCALLACAAPREVPSLLPRVLAAVRLVWQLSGYYNTPERLVGLLRRVAAAVVARCAAAARTRDALSAQGEAAARAAAGTLGECAAACEAFKAEYFRAAAAVARARPGDRDWQAVDVAPVFTVVDAFMQRCRDLLDLCQAQLQFAPIPAAPPGPCDGDVGGGGRPHEPAGGAGEGRDEAAEPSAAVARGLVLPVFGGALGAELEKGVGRIAAAFEGLLAGLRRLGYDILDPKALR